MKKVGLSDTVLVEILRKLRVERVKSAFFAVSFWQGKVRSTLVKNGKKISRACVGGSGYHIKLDLTIFYLVGPDGPPKKRLSYVNFCLDFGIGIVLEIIVKV